LSDDEKKDSKAKAILSSTGRIAKKATRATLIGGAILAPIFGIANLWGKWVYQVRTNYGVVVTSYDGERKAIKEAGWHVRTPFLSTYEGEYAMANQMAFLNGKSHPHEVITKGGRVIVAAASTFYSIKNLKQYAIENVKEDMEVIERRMSQSSGMVDQHATFSNSPKEMIRRTLDSIIGAHIQKTEDHRILYDRAKVEEEILSEIKKSELTKKYGIKVNEFKFTETHPLQKVVEANAQRQTLKTVAEGKLEAAKIQKKTIETLAEADAAKYKTLEKALNPKTAEEKRKAWELFQSLRMYESIKNGSPVWVMPNGQSPSPVYSPGKKRGY
jgi:regulator of protease activity HflC (stomatin/prohibitin superfamily)